ncbi:MAG: sulfur carrier protein ThiS, partial [Opitutaceae bacterium]|nr:sulfur carrier protein ThiS [Opitutaceae bacterium]
MIIRVNDQPREVAADLALADLVRDLGLADRKGVAIAINDEVAPRSTWPTR